MNLRILRTLGALAAVPLLLPSATATAALADGTDGRIDHVESDGQGGARVLFSIPGLDNDITPDPSTIHVTLNGKSVAATAETVAGGDDSIRRTAILAIDVSESMQGPAFEAAKSAANAYIEHAPADVYVGVVTFASTVVTVSEPTQNRASLTESIDALHLSSGTLLYEGVLQSLDLAGDGGLRSLLVLSDGKDTGSTPLSSVLSAAKDAETRVDVVALNQDIDESSPLAQLSRATKGTITSTSDLKALERVFAGEADELAKQLLVTFDVPSDKAVTEGSLDISVSAAGATYADSAFVALNGQVSARDDGPVYESAGPGGLHASKTWLLVGAGLLFASLAVLLGFASTRITAAAATPMQQQLSLYTVHGMKRSEKSSRVDGSAQFKDSAVAIAQELIDKRDFEANLNHKLDRAGLKLKAAEWILLHSALTLGGGFLGFVLTRNIFVTLIFLVIGSVLPWLFLSFKEGRRIKAFNGQLAQTLQVIAGALQAGLSLPQAVDTVVQEGQEPMVSEFRRAIIEQRLGVDIEDSLDTVADRMASIDFKWVVMAIRIQREVGGNLSELLLNVAATLREREYLRRQVQVLSAEGRMSAYILGGMPPIFFLYLYTIRPTYLHPMLVNPAGWAMLGAASVMMLVGFVWLKQVVKVEV